MWRFLTASADTYITDKIIGGLFRATDANVGQAGTLDLFKLYGESKISGSETPTELSRVLVKFDLDPVRQLTSSVDFTSPSFKCFLHMFDVYGGQTVPTNFKLSVLPLSRSFDEGFGRDIVQFQDLDSANFVTASESQGGVVAWSLEGANAVGFLGSSDIDVIASGNLGAGVVSLASEQTFSTGEEDLYVDVTPVVSATLAGLIPDKGFRVSFTGSQETDTKTRFVKRFASRHTTNTRLRPRLEVLFDDSVRDDHKNFFFDLSGSIFLRNYSRGTPANVVSGSGLVEITGSDSILLTLTSGAYSQSFVGSQHKNGSLFQTGIYSTSFAIPSIVTQLTGEIETARSATFSAVWSSLDGTVAFLSSSLVVFAGQKSSFDDSVRSFTLKCTETRGSYVRSERPRFRIFAQSMSVNDVLYTKLPVESTSLVFEDAYYRIRDANSNDIMVPFDTIYKSTKMSTDSNGMYFDIFMDSLDVGRVYEIDVLVKDHGRDQVFTNVGARFRVDL